MAIKNLFDTKLPFNWTERCSQELNYSVAEAHYDKIVYVIFKAVTGLLSNAKSKSEPTTFVFDNMGKEVANATVQYFADEDDTAAGTWSIVWSFDSEDIPANAKKIFLTNVDTHPYFNGAGTAKYGLSFYSDGDLVAIVNVTLEELKKYLEENAKEGEVVGVEVPNVVQARVTVENGVKVFAIEPAGEIKMDIKDDSVSEK